MLYFTYYFPKFIILPCSNFPRPRLEIPTSSMVSTIVSLSSPRTLYYRRSFCVPWKTNFSVFHLSEKSSVHLRLVHAPDKNKNTKNATFLACYDCPQHPRRCVSVLLAQHIDFTLAQSCRYCCWVLGISRSLLSYEIDLPWLTNFLAGHFPLRPNSTRQNSKRLHSSLFRLATDHRWLPSCFETLPTPRSRRTCRDSQVPMGMKPLFCTFVGYSSNGCFR